MTDPRAERPADPTELSDDQLEAAAGGLASSVFDAPLPDVSLEPVIIECPGPEPMPPVLVCGTGPTLTKK